DRRGRGDADGERYARTKHELAQRTWKYVQNYADAKSEVVEEIIARARQGADVVETAAEAEGLERPPLLVLDRVRSFLDERGLGSGPIRAKRIGEDESVIGVPFYVMGFLDGSVVSNELPAGLDEAARRRLGEDLVDALVEIHSADVSEPALAAFVRPGSYLERQVRRFTQLWEVNQTRELPQVVEVGRWLAEHLPDPQPPTAVHGDYRLGNVM